MLHLIEHPVIAARLTRLRDARCSPGEFRQLDENGFIRPGLGPRL